MARHNYIAERAKGFSTRLLVGSGDDEREVSIQFVDGQYNTEDEDVAEAIDKAIATFKISRFCRKVDRAAAERLAAEFLAKQRRMGGTKGQLSALAAQQAMRTEIQKRDESFEVQNVDVAKLAEESEVQLTEEVANPRIQEVANAVETSDTDTAAKTPALKLGG